MDMMPLQIFLINFRLFTAYLLIRIHLSSYLLMISSISQKSYLFSMYLFFKDITLLNRKARQRRFHNIFCHEFSFNEFTIVFATLFRPTIDIFYINRNILCLCVRISIKKLGIHWNHLEITDRRLTHFNIMI